MAQPAQPMEYPLDNWHDWFMALPVTSTTIFEIRRACRRRNYPLIKHDRKEKHRKQWLAKQAWYRPTTYDELMAEPQVELTTKEYGDDGFWEQFKR